MNDMLVFAGLIAGWIVLNVWILPLFGIRTCMSGGCRFPRVEHAEPRRTTHTAVHEYPVVREREHS